MFDVSAQGVDQRMINVHYYYYYLLISCVIVLISSSFLDNIHFTFLFRVQKASLDMLWEYSPSSANLASNWLRAKRALPWLRKKGLERKRKMDGVDISLPSEGSDPFVDLWEAQPCLWDRE